jgi:hypothetical protein
MSRRSETAVAQSALMPFMILVHRSDKMSAIISVLVTREVYYGNVAT